MNGRLSAYAALGLRPGANRAQIDEAYRRLIKLHHPDRMGGDAERAAEINRAYRELRQNPSESRPIRMQPPRPAARPRRMRWRRALPIAVVVAGLLFVGDRSGWSASRLWADTGRLALMDGSGPGNAAGLVPFDNLQEPLSTDSIARSVADAVRLHQGGSAGSVLQYSQTCQAQLRNHPDVVWFDTCTAYDEAIVFLESRDPLKDSGPFGTTAVTSREMGGARLLSDDAVVAESRVHRIRDQVVLVLLSEAAPLQVANIDTSATPSPENEADNLDSAENAVAGDDANSGESATDD